MKVLQPSFAPAAAVLVLVVAGVAAVRAQPTSDAPSFEVASVRPNSSNDGRVMIGMQPGGRFNAINVTLRMLIRSAWQLQEFQIVGGPDWMASDRWDVVAKADGELTPGVPGGPPGRLQLMLRSLLAERFKLQTHTATREMPVYHLVPARDDGRLGPQLQPSTADCGAQAGRRRGAPPGPPAGPPPDGRPACGIRFGPGQLSAGGFPLSQFASSLSPFIERIVVDRTGLQGNYDFDLTWTPDRMPQGPPLPGAPALPPIDPHGPSIFTAIQEQLGLKLEAARGPVEVLVVDGVEKPEVE